MAKGLSATQRTLRELRNQGRVAEITEKWVTNPKLPGGGFRKDLFGIIDVLALDPERGFVGVQCCTGGYQAHLRKMIEEKAQESLDWLNTPGGCLELWSWRKVKVKRGGKAMIWKPRIKEITKGDIL